MNDLKALKDSGERNTYSFDRPDPSLLESIPSPARAGQVLSLEISVPEFTSLCPITGQPDFAEIVITYRPSGLLVESKSLKLYLMGYRQHGAFHESVTCQIHEDLWNLLSPEHLLVVGKFTPRGGIPFHPTVERWA
jgi:7-cyano-7-deazaguanine reductase